MIYDIKLVCETLLTVSCQLRSLNEPFAIYTSQDHDQCDMYAQYAQSYIDTHLQV